MKVIRTLVLLVMLSGLSVKMNAQVENVLKQALPQLYGDLKITPDKTFDGTHKYAYRKLYFDLAKALDDVKAFEIGAANEEVMKVLDYKTVKQLEKKGKLDSLKTLIKEKMVQINDFMKWKEKYAADTLSIAVYWRNYKDNFKAKKYDEAYKFWSILFRNYPLVHSSIYSGGVILLKNKIKNAKDSTIRKAYIDTLFMLFDQQEKVYPKRKAYVEGRRVYEYYELYVNGQDPNDSIVRQHIRKCYDLSENAIKEGGDNTPYFVFPIAMKMTLFVNLLDTNKVSNEKAIENYLLYSDILNKQYQKAKDDKRKQKIKKYGLDIIDQMFSKADFATCEHLCPAFKVKFERDSNNIDNVKKTMLILSKKGCFDCDLYTKVAVKLYELEPTASSANGVALLYAKEGKTEQALKFVDQAIKLETVDTLKAEYYFEGAQLFNKMKNYIKAREYARQAIKLNPHFGKPYILIATMYAATANSVGDDKFAHNAVYWVAVDLLNKAKSVDPSVADQANSFIKSYSSHFPKKEEGFMQGVYEGQEYTVGGWIQETTKARYYK